MGKFRSLFDPDEIRELAIAAGLLEAEAEPRMVTGDRPAVRFLDPEPRSQLPAQGFTASQVRIAVVAPAEPPAAAAPAAAPATPDAQARATMPLPTPDQSEAFTSREVSGPGLGSASSARVDVVSPAPTSNPAIPTAPPLAAVPGLISASGSSPAVRTVEAVTPLPAQPAAEAAPAIAPPVKTPSARQTLAWGDVDPSETFIGAPGSRPPRAPTPSADVSFAVTPSPAAAEPAVAPVQQASPVSVAAPEPVVAPPVAAPAPVVAPAPSPVAAAAPADASPASNSAGSAQRDAVVDAAAERLKSLMQQYLVGAESTATTGPREAVRPAPGGEATVAIAARRGAVAGEGMLQSLGLPPLYTLMRASLAARTPLSVWERQPWADARLGEALAIVTGQPASMFRSEAAWRR
jgi:hypothetical protein